MSDQTTSTEELQDRLRRLEAFMENSPMAVFMKDELGRYVYFNERMKKMYYAPLTDLEGKTDFDWLPAYIANEIRATDQKVLETGNTIDSIQTVPTMDGGEMHFAVYRFLFVNSAGEKFVGGIAADITELKEMQQKLEDLSLTDELTGLNNRRGFLVLAKDRLEVAKRNGENLLVVFGDMDGLKIINDTHGHAAGSEAIATTAAILKDSFRNSDVLSRWGGDEFVALLAKATHEKAEKVVRRFDERLADYNRTSGLPYQLSVSTGIHVIDPDSADTLDQAIEEADKIMYENKRRKKDESQ